MTEHIKKINVKIKEYYDYIIKLSGKNQDNFNFENFIKEITLLFNEVPKNNDNNEDDDILKQLLGTSEVDLINRLEENIKEIENGVKEIKNNFENKKEIFLDFDFFRESKGLSLTLNDFNKNYDGYLGGYYILALKSLLVLWKNEINLLDESMSFHHREKSILDIKRIHQILKKELENKENLDDGKNILKEILEYSEFLCNKFEITPITFITEYKKTYEKFIKVIDFIEIKDADEVKKNDIKDELELFKYFLYIKDEKFKEEPNKSYKILKDVFEKFKFENDSKNVIFFINNLISLLNKISENNDKNFNYNDEINFINDFIDNKNIDETYFTYYKIAQLYKNLGKLNKNGTNFKTSEDNINLSIEKFEEQNGAYYPFYATSNIFDNYKGIFSFSTFIITQKTDYYLKIKQEQIKILEEKSELKLSLKLEELDKKILSSEEKINDTLYNNNVKTIEILAIFSAIIMFVSSSIQIYQYLTDTYSAIIFLLGFSLSLIGFIGLLIFLFSKNISVGKYIIFLIIFIIGFISIYHFSKINKPLFNNDYKDKIKNEIIDDLGKIKNIFNQKN